MMKLRKGKPRESPGRKTKRSKLKEPLAFLIRQPAAIFFIF